MPDIKHVVTNDWDWQGLYVDGKLVYEGHDIPIFTWLKIVGGPESIEVELDEEAGECNFPPDFSDLGIDDPKA